MNAPLGLQNLMAYCLQIVLLAGGGLVVSRMLRLRSPAVMYRYAQALLAVCLLLPLVQPWRHGVANGDGTTASHILFYPGDAIASLAPHPAARWIILLLAAGTVFRLISLALGLIKLRRYRAGASRLKSLPPGVHAMAARLKVAPDFRLSGEIQGPVTFGLRRAVVLLPPRFAEMDADRQQAVASHELLHIIRQDWAMNLAEELVLAALWFHPVIWWLVGRIRLNREQVVDQQVVQLTGDRMPYLYALIEIAAGLGAIRGLVAPAFLKECQLAERIRTLTQEDIMTKPRITITLVSVAALTLLAGFVAVCAFPLRAATSPVTNQDQASPVTYNARDPGVTLPVPIFKPDPAYTKQARDAKIKGNVELMVVVGADGTVTSAKVQKSLDPGLDQNTVNTIKTWKFKPATKGGKPVPVKVTVEVSYKLL